jgi:Putative Ig domain
MTLFLIQVALSTNSIDRDLALKLDQATDTVDRLKETAHKAEATEALSKALDGEAKEVKRQVSACQASLSESQQASVVCQVSRSECERKLGASSDARELRDTIASLKEQCRAAAAGGVVIATSMLPSPVANHAYALTLAAEGGVPPLHWSLSGALPEGLLLDPDRGVISGIAKSTGKSDISVTVRDSSKEVSSNSRNLPIEVVQAGLPEQKAKSLSFPWWSWLLMLGPAVLWVVGKIRYKLWIADLHRRGVKVVQLDVPQD